MNMQIFRVQGWPESCTASARARREVLMDDRKERPGVMFCRYELIGIPHTIALAI